MRLAFFSVVLAACTASTAPERRCTEHEQCDDGFLCGPDGLCQPSRACGGDDDCCPGAVCFSGWCRPTPECAIGDACPALGAICEARGGLTIAGAPGPLGDATAAGLCVPAACDALGGCPDPFTCIAGRCLLGAPCEGRCGPSQLCEPATDRCLAAPPGCECADGWAVATDLQTTPLSCDLGSYQCDCARLPAVSGALPGVDGRLAPSDGDAPSLVSYEPAYGDLVLSRFDAGGTRADVALDGVPAAPVTADGDYRGGIVEPGPDRGARPAVAPGPGVDDILYRDLDRQREMFTRVDLAGARRAIGELAIDGLEVGRYSCLARRADGRLAGLVFVSRDPSDTVAQLLRVETRGADPVSGDDWIVTEVLETPLPPRSDAPCGNACGIGEVCVLDGASEACGGVVSLGGNACGDCGPHGVCADVGGNRACRARVYRQYDADRLPFGEGLFASCSVDSTSPGSEVYAAWYDADRERLVAARWPFAPGDRVIVDEGAGKDVGRFASIAVAGARIGIAYQDFADSTLVFAEAASWGAAFRSEVLPTLAGAEPGNGARLVYAGGTPVVVDLDGRRAEVELLARGDGCWGRTLVFGGEGYAYPDAIAGGGGAWVSAQALRFDDQLHPHHAPVVANVPLPACP